MKRTGLFTSDLAVTLYRLLEGLTVVERRQVRVERLTGWPVVIRRTRTVSSPLGETVETPERCGRVRR